MILLVDSLLLVTSTLNLICSEIEYLDVGITAYTELVYFVTIITFSKAFLGFGLYYLCWLLQHIAFVGKSPRTPRTLGARHSSQSYR